MPDRSALKRNATEKIRTSNPRVITVALVYLLLSLLVNLLSSRLLSVNMTATPRVISSITPRATMSTR